MGINEKVLTEFAFSTGESIRIEFTQGERVHIHIDRARLEMTDSEFLELVSTVSEADQKLAKIKDL